MRIVVSGHCYKRYPLCQICVHTTCSAAGVIPNQNSLFEVIFMHPSEIQQLNNRFRHKNSATDVLAFAGDKERWIGSVALNIHAIYRKTPPPHSVYCTLIHGVLHTLGYDHATTEQEAQMKIMEDKVYLKMQEFLRKSA